MVPTLATCVTAAGRRRHGGRLRGQPATAPGVFQLVRSCLPGPAHPAGHPHRMALVLFLLFVVAPVVELAVIVQVAGSVGVANTIGLLIAVSLLGAWLAKREGIGVLGRIQLALDRGQTPGTELVDGGLILLAGALMIAPGFISDVLALLLLLPPTRAVVRIPVLRYVTKRGRIAVADRFGGFRATGGRVRDDGSVDVWDVESWEEPPRPPVSGELGGDRR